MAPFFAVVLVMIIIYGSIFLREMNKREREESDKKIPGNYVYSVSAFYKCPYTKNGSRPDYPYGEDTPVRLCAGDILEFDSGKKIIINYTNLYCVLQNGTVTLWARSPLFKPYKKSKSKKKKGKKKSKPVVKYASYRGTSR